MNEENLQPRDVTRKGIALVLIFFVQLVSGYALAAADPLPSWKDQDSRKAIMAFVEATIDEESDAYVAPVERIATFDNDGTLWAEQPMYFQAIFALDRVRVMARQRVI